MKRVLALRQFEEEREEADLRRQRRSREACLEALQASEMRRIVASQELHAALDKGDRSAAISAEMVLACEPMERGNLEQRLTQLDAAVATATIAWQASRLRKRQMESLMTGIETGRRREQLSREQKALDGWFLSSRVSSLSRTQEGTDESFQREVPVVFGRDGTAHAEWQGE